MMPEPMNTGEPGAAAPPEPPVLASGRPPAARDLVRVAQGCYLIFWGLLVTLVMAGQLLMGIPLPSLMESFLAAGVVSIVVGSWRMHQADRCGDLWRARTATALAWAGLLAYGAVFLHLWRRVPDNFFLQINALVFPVVYIWYLVAFGRAATALADDWANRQLRQESRWYSVATVVLLLVPFSALAIFVMVLAVLQKENPLFWLRYSLARVPTAVLVVVLLPLALTLSLAWAIKDLALQRLSAYEPGQPKAGDGAP